MDKNFNPHEFLRNLRAGDEPKCPECKRGIVKPIGDYKTTHGFACTECKFRININ